MRRMGRRWTTAAQSHYHRLMWWSDMLVEEHSYWLVGADKLSEGMLEVRWLMSAWHEPRVAGRSSGTYSSTFSMR